MFVRDNCIVLTTIIGKGFVETGSFGAVQEPPSLYNLSEKYWQYIFNLYRNTPPSVTLCLAGF